MNYSSNFLILLCVKVVQVFIAFVTLRLLTSLMTTDELANYYLVLALLAFFNLVLLNPAAVYFGRNILEWKKKCDLVNAFLVFLGYVTFISIIAIIIVSCLIYFFDYDQKFNYLHLMLFVFFALVISTVHRNLLNAINTLGHRLKFAILLMTTVFVGFMFSCFFFFLVSKSALFWLTGIVLSECIFIFVLLRIYAGDTASSIGVFFNFINLDKIRHLFSFCIPIALTTLFMWGQNISYRFVVDYKYSTEVLAELAIAFGVAAAVFSSLESIAMQHYNPIFLRNIFNKDKETMAQAWNSMAAELIPVYLLTTMFVILFSKPLLVVLVDSKYHHIQYFVMIAAVFELSRVLTNLLNNVSQAVYQTSVTVAPYALGGSLATLSLIILDLSNNTLIIPMIMAGSYMLTLLFMFCRMRQLLQLRIYLNLLLVGAFSIPFFVIKTLIDELDIYGSLLIVVSAGLYLLVVIFFLVKDAQAKSKNSEKSKQMNKIER